jgi:hypothetical protein
MCAHVDCVCVDMAKRTPSLVRPHAYMDVFVVHGACACDCVLRPRSVLCILTSVFWVHTGVTCVFQLTSTAFPARMLWSVQGLISIMSRYLHIVSYLMIIE